MEPFEQELLLALESQCSRQNGGTARRDSGVLRSDCAPPHVEILTPKVIALGGGAFGR